MDDEDLMSASVQVNLERVYAANLSTLAWGCLGLFIKRMQEKGYIAGIDPGELWYDGVEELVEAGIVKRFGRNIKIDPDVVKFI